MSTLNSIDAFPPHHGNGKNWGHDDEQSMHQYLSLGLDRCKNTKCKRERTSDIRQPIQQLKRRRLPRIANFSIKVEMEEQNYEQKHRDENQTTQEEQIDAIQS